MTTIDKLLLKITSHTTPTIEEYMPAKDSRVMRSLSSAVNTPGFITENQSRLLLKLLYQYKHKFLIVENNIEQLLTTPSWSKTFKVVEVVKKVYIKTPKDQNSSIFIEFSHNPTIRKILQNLGKSIEGGVITHSTKLISVDLTEKNIVSVVELLTPQKFDFDQKIHDFYEIIKKWDFNEECKKFFFGENLLDIVRDSLVSDVGLENINNTSIIYDRKTRYHFLTKKTEKNEENLEDLIIHRTQQKILIDSKKYTLSDVIKNLKKISRLPLLLIFDTWTESTCNANLKNLQKSLEENEIFEDVGIYFRLQNTTDGKLFNQFIQDQQYNKPLGQQTQVAGIQVGKLPKFFLKDCNWSPKSVIVLGTNLRHSKTAVYSNRCDLIISYADKPSIFDNHTGWATSTWAL
jgi:hypothetical protein